MAARDHEGVARVHGKGVPEGQDQLSLQEDPLRIRSAEGAGAGARTPPSPADSSRRWALGSGMARVDGGDEDANKCIAVDLRAVHAARKVGFEGRTKVALGVKAAPGRAGASRHGNAREPPPGIDEATEPTPSTKRCPRCPTIRLTLSLLGGYPCPRGRS